MDFLKSCSTNAQAIGDYEAVAYQAFSVTHDSNQPPSQLRDWPISDHVRATEAKLREGKQLVTQDASRPWLWHFKPITVDMVGQDTLELPSLEGYTLHREHMGFMKASEMARPPMRPGNLSAFALAATSLSNAGPQKSIQGAGARRNSQADATDQQQSLDCFTVYELFISSVTALISFYLVKNCGLVALNYRTLVSKPMLPQEDEHVTTYHPADSHWLTSINVHWISAGTLLLTTTTERTDKLLCLDSVPKEDEKQLIGRCIRVAPNAMLAKICSFDDPLEALTEDTHRRVPKKKVKTGSLEQSIEKWKIAVERWLDWRGYSFTNLNNKNSWVRIRIAHQTHLPMMSPSLPNTDRDMLWPRALCFVCNSEPMSAFITEVHGTYRSQSSLGDLRWFEAPGSAGFKDPIDVAQEWFLGKTDRDKLLEARRRAKKTEEEALRRKDEPPALHPSSPFNARTAGYGDLQVVSGVYPTPPDGIIPGPAFSSSDTPSATGAPSNIVLAPGGGSNPAINLSVPQDYRQADEHQNLSTSPLFPATLEPFQTGGEDDDLFEDIEGDGYGASGVNDADFDFFDAPDGDDVDMADAPTLPQTIQDTTLDSGITSDLLVKEEMSDPIAALENALATPSQPIEEDVQDTNSEQEETSRAPPISQLSEKFPTPQAPIHIRQKPVRSNAPTPPLSPGLVAKTLRPSSPKAPPRNGQISSRMDRADSAFNSLEFGRRMSLVDAKYQDGRFAASHESDAEKECAPNTLGATRVKSLRDLPLLTKFRYAIGVSSRVKIPELTSLARADSDSSDSDVESELSDASEQDVKDVTEVRPPPFFGRIIIPAKRKLPTEGHGTPLSVTSFADSFGGDWQDLNGLQLDDASLAFFEPNTWDWPILNVLLPAERPLAGARYILPSLPPSNVQLPDTPTSQPEVSMELPEERPVNGKDSIAITQILTDQIISATLDILGEDHSSGSKSSNQSSETRWQAALKKIFPSAEDCSVSTLAAIHDVYPALSAQAKAQHRAPPRKLNESNAIPSCHMYPMNPPFVRVRRADTLWDLLPPSIGFWEPLGLHPVSPPKNIVAFCVHPHSDPLRPILERFLLNLQLAYDTCKLGMHARVETLTEYEGGLVPWKVNSPISQKEAVKALRETCTQLGKVLALQHSQIQEQQETKIDAFVVYIVDPFGNPVALWELCSAFWALFQAYGQGPPGRPDQIQKPDLVLQIVPMKYLASFDVPVILDASTYINLAREVYDRCPPGAASTDKTPLGIYKAPAFHLEEGLPRHFQFKLQSEPPQDPLREHSYMHLAYAISLDGTWVTAAWTDSCGKSQAVVSYHLCTRPFTELAKEIWQTTIEIMQSRRVQWRVCIAKVGAMDREELESWVPLITYPTPVNIFLTLLTAIGDSPYKFTPNALTTGSGGGQPSTHTPGSTPQAGISPDPTVGLTPAATPSADTLPDPSLDPEARLIDVTDETWGIVLAHRLHNSNSTNQFSPALVSGLLVKRGETHSTTNTIHHPIPDPMSGPIVVAINMLWIGAVSLTRTATSSFPPSTAAGSAPSSPSAQQERTTGSLMWTPTVQTRATGENLLKEVMTQFRALGLLAKLRGMRGTRHGSLPWHVVAAKRGVEGLEKVTGSGL
ncbi:mediator complex subunit 13 C-terminal-domain-containing protein [Phaeosphaeriaceae sp. PMI808]|nr:mediator complex subunit 13 C-terminal-domain-containing protein [Phaeosphaeriaceae sp. PMI808]